MVSGKSVMVFRALKLVVVILLATVCDGSDWTDSRDSYATLYSHYYNGGVSLTDIIPVNNQSAGIKIRLSMTLDSLNGFDAVKGEIDISGSIKLEWTDEAKTYASLTFPASTQTLLIDYDKTWAPSLVLLNAVDTVKDIGDTTYKLEYNLNTFLVKWQPRVLLRAACTPDVTYYPFDRQECSFTYTAWGYMSEEIQLEVTSSEWDMSRYSDNGVWSIAGTKSSTYQDGGSDFADFVITIEREPLYFTFNIALPILLLGLLNGFVFLLPFESGERVGFYVTCFLSFVVLLQTTMDFMPQLASPMSLLCYYVFTMMCFSALVNILTILMIRVLHHVIGFCVTCFLSFVVLLQTTMDFMPQLASPMSLLCYYVFTMMCFSALVNILTILMLRVYHKDTQQEVPKWMRLVVRVVSCKICRKSTAPEEEEKVTWPEVGRVLDWFFFLGFIVAQAVFTMTFILPIGTNNS